MTRTITPSLAGVLEELELEQPELVTLNDLAGLLEEHGVRTPAKVVAARLRQRGWLLPTAQRGVWEFAPAAVAGAHSRSDPVTPFRAFLTRHPGAVCALTFQAAAWAHGVADRAPARLEVAAATSVLARGLPSALAGTVFAPQLDTPIIRSVPVLAPESVIVHMTTRPAAVRSWASALEWFPELTHSLTKEALMVELDQRSLSVRTRTGYLLQGLRPDLAAMLRTLGISSSKGRFGPRGPLRRHDAAWQIADTLLPFDPRTLRENA